MNIPMSRGIQKVGESAWERWGAVEGLTTNDVMCRNGYESYPKHIGSDLLGCPGGVRASRSSFCWQVLRYVSMNLDSTGWMKENKKTAIHINLADVRRCLMQPRRTGPFGRMAIYMSMHIIYIYTSNDLVLNSHTFHCPAAPSSSATECLTVVLDFHRRRCSKLDTGLACLLVKVWGVNASESGTRLHIQSNYWPRPSVPIYKETKTLYMQSDKAKGNGTDQHVNFECRL
ncbi:hypothetical protein ACRALDRAFT_2022396 [Sodiomyces alcalophilus JCM 7366]|uniref:uncharacterized protein n=1 Tax=Sodiomyces alcalophilus JCM 7366 TaxID=591952 RepID=UPI0039B6BAB3